MCINKAYTFSYEHVQENTRFNVIWQLLMNNLPTEQQHLSRSAPLPRELTVQLQFMRNTNSVPVSSNPGGETSRIKKQFDSHGAVNVCAATSTASRWTSRAAHVRSPAAHRQHWGRRTVRSRGLPILSGRWQIRKVPATGLPLRMRNGEMATLSAARLPKVTYQRETCCSSSSNGDINEMTQSCCKLALKFLIHAGLLWGYGVLQNRKFRLGCDTVQFQSTSQKSKSGLGETYHWTAAFGLQFQETDESN
jgi:hypothetical protein